MNIFLAAVENNRAVLNPEESWHCAKVLRKKTGDVIRLIDGKGSFYEARLDAVSDKQCVAMVTQGPVAQEKRDYRLHLAIAPTKQMDRMEWMGEKAVEIGLDEISFVICEHSERTAIKTDRISKIALSAVKQSLQARIPQINEAVKFREFIAAAGGSQKFIAWCGEGKKAELRDQRFAGKSNVVMIGPEGDFTPDEIHVASGMGFIHLSLGTNRLRTETAGLAVVQAASLL